MFRNRLCMPGVKLVNLAELRFLLIGFSCALSVACAPESAKVTEVRDYRATFLCDGGQPVLVRFSPYNAVLESQGVSVAMTQQPAADGYRYTGGGQGLRARGAEATWTDGKGAVHHCREATAASPKSNISNR